MYRSKSYVDQERFQHSRRGFFFQKFANLENIAPANRIFRPVSLNTIQTTDMVGFQLVINDNRLEINKYTRFVGSDSTSRTR
jgi:hypothetical protein